MPRIAGIVFGAGLCATFSCLTATGSWMFVALIAAGTVLSAMALYTPASLVIVWVIGAPTFFIFLNKVVKSMAIPVLTADRLLFGFIVAVTVAGVLLRKERPFIKTRIEKWMLVFLLVVSASFLSTWPDKPNKELYRGFVLMLQGFIMPFTGYFIARNQRWREKDLRFLFALLSVVGLYITATGVLQLFFKIKFFMPDYLVFEHTIDRATGPFSSPLEYGQVLSVILLLTLFRYARESDSLKRVSLLAMCAVMFGGVILCKTRAPWLALIAALLLVMKKDPRVRKALTTAFVVGVLALAIAAPFLLESKLFQRRIMQVSPIYNRISLYATAVNMVVHNPVLGIGFGYNSFKEAKPEYVLSIGPVGMERYAAGLRVPHNEFLHLFALTGLAGFVPFLVILHSAYRLMSEVEAGPPGQGGGGLRSEMAVYMKGVFLIYVINAMFVDTIFFVYFLTFFYILLGILSSVEADASISVVTPAVAPPGSLAPGISRVP